MKACLPMANNKFYILTLILFSFFLQNSYSQQYKYFISFSDKNGTPYSFNNPSQYLSPRSIERRENQNISINISDLPVVSRYVDSLSVKGCQVLLTSKWLNGALVLATPSQISMVQALPFVVSFNKANRKGWVEQISSSSSLLSTSTSISLDYGPSLNQITMIGVDKMHENGFAGKGKLISVIDGGFENANQLAVFDSLFLKNRILSTYDFLDHEVDVFDDDPHGTYVLSVLAGYLPGNLIGPAWQSEFLLLRSEDNTSENLSEEYYWVRAAEYADSAGTDIISSSLGYNEFDDGTLDHHYSDLTGDVAPITIGADLAASKGIIVVNSAGNEGNKPWHYIFAPADGDSVLAVGAVTPSGQYFYVSSVGPSADGRIKPDLVAQGNNVFYAGLGGGVQSGNGTSFAAPLVAGLAAGLWQKFPALTNMELINYIKRSASQFSNPNNLLGFGIPNYEKASYFIEGNAQDEVMIFPNPIGDDRIKLVLPINELEQSANVIVYDSKGRKISEEHLLRIDIINELKTTFIEQQPGLYLVIVNTHSKEYKLKVIKN